jgi:hypothetical protein
MEKASAQAEAHNAEVITALMSHTGGRQWLYALLERCHLFHNPFSTDNAIMSFACGEMNIGQQYLADIVRYCPNEYILMMREASDRSTASERAGSQNGRRDVEGRIDTSAGGGADSDAGTEDRAEALN